MSRSRPDKGIRIFLVDDHPLMLNALTHLIDQEPGLTVCGTANSCQMALQLIRDQLPDLTITDIALPGRNGIGLIIDILTLLPQQPVLVYSMYQEVIYAERALRAGARGYLMKEEPPENVTIAVRQILQGQIYLSKTMSSSFLTRFLKASSDTHVSVTQQLSNRELEVLEFMGQGLSSRQIADRLHLSIKTIHTYRLRLRDKIGLQDLDQLVPFAVRWFMSQELPPAMPDTKQSE